MSSSPDSKQVFTLAAAVLATLMFCLESSSIPVILPTLETALRGDLKDMQWVMNAYTIACTTVLMAAGTLADRYGRRRLFVVGTVGFGVASLLCGLATSVTLLVAARAVQGLAGGVMLICQVAILSHQFQDERRRRRAFAIWGVALGFGLGFGAMVGGAVAALLNWQWVFWLHAPLAVLAVLAAWLGIEESRDPQAGRLDLGGMLSMSAAVLGAAYYLTQGGELGFGSGVALAVLACAGLSLGAFILIERSHAQPMFDFAVFGIRRFRGALMGCIGMNFSYWPLVIYLPIYYQGALGYGAMAAGLAMLAYTAPTLLLPPLAERFAARYGPRAAITSGLVMLGLGLLMLRLGIEAEHAGWLSLLPGSLAAGIGLGLTQTPTTNTTTGAVPRSRAGMASGIDMSARLITLAINIAAMGSILLAGVAAWLAEALPEAHDAAALRALAEAIAAGGDTRTSEAAHALPVAVMHGALAHGFGWVTLYGATGAFVFAWLAYVMFGRQADEARGDVDVLCRETDSSPS